MAWLHKWDEKWGGREKFWEPLRLGAARIPCVGPATSVPGDLPVGCFFVLPCRVRTLSRFGLWPRFRGCPWTLAGKTEPDGAGRVPASCPVRLLIKGGASEWVRCKALRARTKEHTEVAAAQRAQASPQHSASKLALCVRLALRFVTEFGSRKTVQTKDPAKPIVLSWVEVQPVFGSTKARPQLARYHAPPMFPSIFPTQ